VHTAELVFRFDTPTAATLVTAAVGREIDEIDDDRSKATIAREDRVVRVEIDADDLVALRASLNTWETLLEVAERMVAIGETR
jgi:KEOPS complex subunit Pcc1